jgi:hypothetical protein
VFNKKRTPSRNRKGARRRKSRASAKRSASPALLLFLATVSTAALGVSVYIMLFDRDNPLQIRAGAMALVEENPDAEVLSLGPEKTALDKKKR